MIYGYFLKLVVADRIAIFVDTIYDNIESYSGTHLCVASILFAFQIYCDFSGYSTIAVGASKIMGINLMDNFKSPYLATTVADFWRCWHISLTSWFRDYLYIPLGGNKYGKIRKYINILIVFLISGLWHGAGLSYVVWGGLNGAYQVIGDILNPLRLRFGKVLCISREKFGYKLISCLITFVLVDLSWIFFRATSINQGIEIIRKINTDSKPWILFDGSLYECGLDIKNYWLMIVCIILILVVDAIKKKGFVIREMLLKEDYWFRWLIIALALFFVITFGIWGTGYNEAAFIYFQF